MGGNEHNFTSIAPLSPPTLPTGDVTLVFTDLEGSSELTERFGKAFEAVRDVHFRLLREALQRSGGFEVETAGDALFVAFHQAGAAVRFAVDAQLKMQSHDWAAQLDGLPPLKVRIGMHTGEPHIGRDEVSGRPVYRGAVTNRTARVQGAAHGGQILLSGTTQALTQGALSAEVTLLDLGQHRLKGVGEIPIWQVLHPELPRDFPPITTLDPKRHNLPVPLMPLVGREKEIGEWHALLRRSDTRVLTLWAFGGMGKTRSALQLAEVCATEDTVAISRAEALFPHGVWWVPLDSVKSEDEMVAAIAQSLSVEGMPGALLKEQVWNFLRERRLLLVLDNTEQINEASDIIGALLSRAPQVKCLVTTRNRLGLVAEVLCEVPPLSMEEAARLFVEIVQKAGKTLDPYDRDVLAVCRRLQCVPLALQLAASRVGLLSPAEIVEHLDEPLRFLKSKNAKDLRLPQRALRDAIDWSYQMLDEESQLLFAELSVFAGGFTLVDADAVSDSGDTFDGIAELHRCSFLNAVTDPLTQRTRYYMLDSLRAYACEHLENSSDGGRAVRERHVKHFAVLMDKFAKQLRTATEMEALSQCFAHLDNARAACDYALARNKTELVARLTLSLGGLLQRTGAFREAAIRLQTGLEAANCTPELDNRLRAKIMLARANAHYDAFNWQLAQQLAADALALFNDLGDVFGQGDSCNVLGLIALRGHKDSSSAKAHFAKAIALFSQAGFPLGIAWGRNNQGLCEQADGNSEGARPHFESALEIYREEGYQRGIAEIVNNLGVLTQETGDLEQAWRYYKEAYEIELRLKHQFGVARGLYNLGEVAASQGQSHLAGHLFAGAESLFDRVGSPHQKAAAQNLQKIALADDHWKATQRSSNFTHLKDLTLEQIAQWSLSPE